MGYALGYAAHRFGVSTIAWRLYRNSVGRVADGQSSIPDEAAPETVKITADSTEWRLLVAQWAYGFFHPFHDPQTARIIGKTLRPKTIELWCVADFSSYLSKRGLSGNATELIRILGAMERAGLLMAAGWHPRLPLMGQQYVSQGFDSPQREGNLWLSEVLGAEIIIPSYNAVTVLIAGTDAEGNPGEHWGTGLIIDENHIITNRHVVMGLTSAGGDIEVHLATVPAGAPMTSQPVQMRAHQTLDVAVIETHLPDNTPAFPRLPGMVFREPRWADEVFVFGYPRVPMTAEMAISVQRGQVVNVTRSTEYAVQRGEVVNPETETIPNRHKMFLFSAITRPGNSGGPIVAGDGRVIGLVVEDSAEAISTDSGPESPPFYRGIPSGEVIRALDDMGFGGIIKTEREPKELEIRAAPEDPCQETEDDPPPAEHQ